MGKERSLQGASMTGRVLRFISRMTQLCLREVRTIARFVNRYGQYVYPTAAEQAQVAQEKLEDRRTDSEWNQPPGDSTCKAIVLRQRHGEGPDSGRTAARYFRRCRSIAWC